MNFTDYRYNLTNITALAVDTNNGKYVWLAFANQGGSCLLKKVSAFNMNQVYYTITVPVTSINAMLVTNSQVFLAVTHSTIFNYAYSVTNPLTSSVFINKPSGVVESPIGIGLDGSALYFLTPGVSSAEPSKLIHVNSSNSYIETISLEASGILITDASCITVDTSHNIWVATSTNPSILARVWNSSGWHIEETRLSP